MASSCASPDLWLCRIIAATLAVTTAARHGTGRTNVMHASSTEVLGYGARHLADGTITVAIQWTHDLAEAACPRVA